MKKTWSHNGESARTTVRGGRWSMVRCRSAFTLIEMLTVIAIIGVLAAILLPTLAMVRRKARISTAQGDIANLVCALEQYQSDFGAYPPDTNESLTEVFDDMDTPNECLVWFLTRTYSKTGGAGKPHQTGGGWTTSPQNAIDVNARIGGGPYTDIKAKQRRDYDQDGFSEYTDPWGRPYMYRAYRRTMNVSGGDASAAGADDACTVFFNLEDEASGPYEYAANGLTGILGTVTLSGFSPAAYNGVFQFEGAGDSQIRIAFAEDPGSVTGWGFYRFDLRNRQTCDVYSLGPNGRTRAADRPLDGSNTVEWKPQVSAAEYDKWTQVWGTPGDGNDVADEGNLITEDRDKDDVNNW